MQSKLTQWDVLRIHRQAHEIYSDDLSMYKPRVFTKNEIARAKSLFSKTANLLESIPVELASSDVQGLLGKCYLQSLYFIKLTMNSTQSSYLKHSQGLQAESIVEKLNSLLTVSGHLTETEKHSQLMVCQLFTLGKNKGRGYTKKVLGIAKELDKYYPTNENSDSLEILSKTERVHLAWCLDIVADLIGKLHGKQNASKYIDFSLRIKTLTMPSMLYVTKTDFIKVQPMEIDPVVAEPVNADLPLVSSFILNPEARSALYRERMVGKPEQDFLNTFHDFLIDAREEPNEHKKMKQSQ